MMNNRDLQKDLEFIRQEKRVSPDLRFDINRIAEHALERAIKAEAQLENQESFVDSVCNQNDKLALFNRELVEVLENSIRDLVVECCYGHCEFPNPLDCPFDDTCKVAKVYETVRLAVAKAKEVMGYE